MHSDPQSNSFCIKIDYNTNNTNPKLIFLAMHDLIGAVENIGSDLANSLDVQLRSSIYLEDVQKGSIIAWLRRDLNEIDENNIKSSKNVILEFIAKCSETILKFLCDNDEVKDKDSLIDIQKKIEEQSKNIEFSPLNTFVSINDKKILENLFLVHKALNNLNETEEATYIANDKQIVLNKKFNINEESIEEILTEEKRVEKSIMNLKVKKPDYLGKSKWDFRINNQLISAKIIDYIWLTDFQNRKISINPGDSLNALVQVETYFDKNNDILKTNHNILKINGVTNIEKFKQLDIFDE